MFLATVLHRLGVGLVIKDVGRHVIYADDRFYQPLPPSTRPEHRARGSSWPWKLLRMACGNRSPPMGWDANRKSKIAFRAAPRPIQGPISGGVAGLVGSGTPWGVVAKKVFCLI